MNNFKQNISYGLEIALLVVGLPMIPYGIHKASEAKIRLDGVIEKISQTDKVGLTYLSQDLKNAAKSRDEGKDYVILGLGLVLGAGTERILRTSKK